MSISKPPWKATIGSVGGPTIKSSDGKFIADVRAKFIRVDTTTKLGQWKLEDAGEESADNARLIAAAPDLLEACHDAIHALMLNPDSCYDEINVSITAIRAAIAKAEGKSTPASANS